MGDRIAVMNAGHIAQVDSPLEVYDEPGRHVRRRLRRHAADELPRGARRVERRRARRSQRRRRDASRSSAPRRSSRRARARSSGSGPRAIGVETSAGAGADPRRPSSSIEPLGSHNLITVRTGGGPRQGVGRQPRSSPSPATRSLAPLPSGAHPLARPRRAGRRSRAGRAPRPAAAVARRLGVGSAASRAARRASTTRLRPERADEVPDVDRPGSADPALLPAEDAPAGGDHRGSLRRRRPPADRARALRALQDQPDAGDAARSRSSRRKA